MTRQNPPSLLPSLGLVIFAVWCLTLATYYLAQVDAARINAQTGVNSIREMQAVEQERNANTLQRLLPPRQD